MFRRFRNYPQIGGAKLPYDAEVEWIKGSGKNYIDTLITPTNNTVTEIKFESSTNTIKNGLVQAGVRATNAPTLSHFFWSAQSGYWAYNFGSQLFRSTVRTDTDVHTAVFGKSAYLDGVKLHEFNSEVFRCSNSLIVFSGRQGTDSTLFASDTKLYMVEITEAGRVVFYAIPVRFVNEFGKIEGALYDRVSGSLFRSIGSGSFIIGPDKGKKYDEELSCIISDGRQFSWTSVIPDFTNSFEFDTDVYFYKNEDANLSAVRGDVSTNSRLYLFSPSNGYMSIAYGTARDLVQYNIYNRWLSCNAKIKPGMQVWSVNGAVILTTNISVSASNSNRLPLFGFTQDNKNVQYLSSAYIRKFLVKKNGAVIFSAKPVLKDGVPCFYDSVGDVLIYNESSGHQFGYEKMDGTVVRPT